MERAQTTDAGEVNGFVQFSPESPNKKREHLRFFLENLWFRVKMLGKSMVSGEDFPNKS